MATALTISARVDDSPRRTGCDRVDGPRRFADIIEVEDQYYILATSSLADSRRLVLKQGESFAVFDQFGDVQRYGEGGVFHEGTRFLSAMILSVGESRPLFLSSTVKRDNARLAVDLTNPDMEEGETVKVSRGALHISRTKFLWQGVCYERIRIRNYGMEPVDTEVGIHFEADFADIFEVRGTRRARRGQMLAEQVEHDRVTLGYKGLDGVIRRSRLTFSPSPRRLTGSQAEFAMALQPGGEAIVYITLGCEIGDNAPEISDYDAALEASGAFIEAKKAETCNVYTSNEQFNEWYNRTVADLAMMVTETSKGPYPYAGVPWFSTAFGRDGIITALECLWVNPGLARGVLGFLAATQATEVNDERDAEPGKILHETRRGEMAALKEIPFGRYYGSIDSTPLFVMLASAYYERTGDREFIAQIWPNIERALNWIDKYGDRDGDGFVEYMRHSPQGLVQQGWKDSHDSVFHADGRLAEGPIALCEVQGYVFAAKRGAAVLAAAMGHKDRCQALLSQAETLQARFEEAFWCDDLSIYALALDGKKQPCRVRTSNAGHCLYTGIASVDHARRAARTLLGPEMFSGWGIRTLAANEARYNPMSYHNGSVWPHDNALIAGGLARYGMKDLAMEVLTGLFDASLFVDLHRLPELFCGFIRRSGEGPTLYPVACAPQAWSSASVFLLLQACLGLEIRGTDREVRLSYPVLPGSLKEVRIRGVQVGPAVVDLLLQRHDYDIGVNVLRREGDVSVVVVK